MPGQFGTAPTITGPALAAYAITPGASALAVPIRSVTLSVGGVLAFTSSIDGLNYTTADLPSGSYPLFASHILAATTATGITGWV